MLKQEGFIISSVKNLGHCLENGCNALSEYRINPYLPNEGIEVKVFDCINATDSDLARALYAFGRAAEDYRNNRKDY